MVRRILIFTLVCAAALLCIGCDGGTASDEPADPTSQRGQEQANADIVLPMIEPEDDREGQETDEASGAITVSEVDGMLYPNSETKVSDNAGEQRHLDSEHAVEAQTGRNLYNPGIYECSQDLVPGTYVFYADRPEVVGSYVISDTGSQEHIQGNAFFSQSIAELREGETLDAFNCYFEPIENAGNTVDQAPEIIEDGVWLVGYQIPEGIYTVTLNESDEEAKTNQLRIFEDPAREQAKNIILCTADMTVYLENGDYVELIGVSIAQADANAGTGNNTEGN